MARTIVCASTAAVAVLCAVLVACPVGKQHICELVPGCASGCCDAQHLCAETICSGVPWVCVSAGGKISWQAYAPSCRDMTAPADFVPPSEGVVGDHQRPDLRRDARSPDKRALDCRWDNCGDCPAGWCGPNAECRHNVKCRCVGQYLNPNGVWNPDGCETISPECRPDNCNQCSTGYCGDNADCMQNSCKCVVAGYASCNGSWNPDGCECKGTCSGATCVP